MRESERILLRFACQSAEGIRAIPLTKSQLSRFLAEGHPEVAAGELERARQLCDCTRFQADPGQVLAVSAGQEASCLLLVGRGGQSGTMSFRRAAAAAAAPGAAGQAWSRVVGGGENRAGAPPPLRCAAEGGVFGSYRFRCTTRDETGEGVAGPCTLVSRHVSDGEARAELDWVEAVGEGVLLARDLVNMPAADLGPDELAEAARSLAQRHALEVQSFRGDELLEQRFPLVHAVGRASSRPPTFTVVRYGAGSRSASVGLIGKGVIFDTGGLNLKPTSAMLLMRKDMGGAGTVLGILEAVARLQLDVNVLAVLPSAENAVGPDSFRPGDILTSRDGRTVEIGNTDAEGRLLLADGLTYAREEGCARLLDLATLTGSARAALGPDVPALFGTDEEMVGLLEDESVRLDEPVWRLPLVESYDSWLDSPFADVNHIASDHRAGAITAALFLRRFVGETPWSHLDLYGWEDKGKPEQPRGATGICVRTVVAALERLVSGAASDA